MFSKSVLAIFSWNALLTQGSQLRGSTRSRNLSEDVSSSTCIPVGEAPFTKTVYVVVDLNGTQAINASTLDLFNLASTFDVTYDQQVDCSVIAGSRREVGRANVMIDALGPDGVASKLLRVDVFCNACGDGEDVELFGDSSTTIGDPIEDVGNVECSCDGPFLQSFVEMYQVVFALTTSSDIGISDVHQLSVLECGEQNITSFNVSGVCLGPDARAVQADEEFQPSTYPSEYPSEFPSEFP
jgi:hypothetical protein